MHIEYRRQRQHLVKPDLTPPADGPANRGHPTGRSRRIGRRTCGCTGYSLRRRVCTKHPRVTCRAAFKGSKLRHRLLIGTTWPRCWNLARVPAQVAGRNTWATCWGRRALTLWLGNTKYCHRHCQSRAPALHRSEPLIEHINRVTNELLLPILRPDHGAVLRLEETPAGSGSAK